jgi:hypothetical protein
LLTRGVKVLGVDPAKMAPAVTANPNFTHIRRRVSQVPRREFRKIRPPDLDQRCRAGSELFDVVV